MIISNIIKCLVKKSSRVNRIFTGISMGGYAALTFSSYFDNGICISFSPQTLKLQNYVNSDQIYLNKANTQFDLRDHLIKYSSSCPKYIIVGPSECDSMAYWGDLLMSGHLINIKNIKILLVAQQTHSTFYYIDFNKLSELLINNYKILKSNMDHGLNILKNNKLYYPQKIKQIQCSIDNEPCIFDDKNTLTYENIKLLNASNITSAIIRNKSLDWLICFSDTNNFNILPTIKKFNGNILYYRNTYKFDESIIKKLNTKDYLLNANKIFIIGCNLSGNIAFCVSCYFTNSICITFNPITFDNSSHYYDSQNIQTVQYNEIIDLKNINKLNTASKYIITNISECNSDEPFTLSTLYAGYMINEENVKILVIKNKKYKSINDIYLDSLINMMNIVKYEDLKNQNIGETHIINNIKI